MWLQNSHYLSLITEVTSYFFFKTLNFSSTICAAVVFFPENIPNVFQKLESPLNYLLFPVYFQFSFACRIRRKLIGLYWLFRTFCHYLLHFHQVSIFTTHSLSLCMERGASLPTVGITIPWDVYCLGLSNSAHRLPDNKGTPSKIVRLSCAHFGLVMKIPSKISTPKSSICTSRYEFENFFVFFLAGTYQKCLQDIRISKYNC